MKPAITSIPKMSNIQKASVIHIVALHCIFLSSLSE